jgi:predicted dehydrogenase
MSCASSAASCASSLRTLPDVEGETFASLFLETAAGAPVEVTGTMAAPGYPPRASDRLEIIGSKASAVFEQNMLRRLGPDPLDMPFDNEKGYQASFDGVIRHFVECLESGAQFETDPSDNIETLRLVEHGYWAAGLAR